jgi:GAF domain-containing protein
MGTNNSSGKNVGNGSVKFIKKLVDALIKPHSSIDDLATQRQVRLLSSLALVLTLASSLGFVSVYSPETINNSLRSLGINIMFSLMSYLLSRTRLYRLGIISLIANFIVSGFFIAYSGAAENSAFSLLSTVTLSLLIGNAFLSVRNMGILTGIVILLTLLVPIVAPQGNHGNINSATGLFLTWGLALMIFTASRNEVERERLSQIRKVNDELIELQENLEQRVEERNRELSLASELGQILSQVRERDELLEKSVSLIRERFDLYYVQIYLTDSSGAFLVLQAGSGEVGQRLKQRGHRLPIDATSLNGRAAHEKKPVVISDTSQTKTFRPNPLLPQTHSEMCIPLLIGDRVVGVLDIQSNRVAELQETRLPGFASLAGQLAVAIENSALYQEQKAATEIIEIQNKRLTKEGWEDFLNAIDQPKQINAFFEQTVLSQGEPLSMDGAEQGNIYEAGINISGVPVGSLQLERNSAQSWQEEEIEIVKAVTEQIANRIENLRLLSQAERYRLEAEAVTRSITREGWRSFLTEAFGGEVTYFYDCDQVQQLSGLPNTLEMPGVTFTEPLKVRDEVIGEIVISGQQELDDKTKKIIKTLSERLSDHIENLRLSTQTQEALARTDTLYQISQRLQESDDFGKALVEVLKILIKSTGADKATFITFNDHYSKLTRYFKSDVGDIDLGSVEAQTILSGIFGWVIREQKSVLIFKEGRDPRESDTEYEARLTSNSGSMLIVPIEAQNHVSGIIALEVRKEYPNFTNRDLETAEAVANQLAISIENRNLLDRTQSLAQREQNLRQITSRIRSDIDPELIVNSATNYLGSILKREVYIKIDKSSKDMDVTSRVDSNDGIDNVNGAFLSIPLKFRGGEAVGHLQIHDDPINPLSTEDISFIHQVAEQIALALESARLFTQTQQALTEMDALYNIIAGLNAARDFNSVLEVLSKRTVLRSADQSLLMFLFDSPLAEDRNPEWVLPIACQSDKAITLADRYPLNAFEVVPNTLFTHSPVFLEDITRDIRLDRITRTLFEEIFSAKSSIIIPLLLGHQSMGFIMANFGKPSKFTEAEIGRLSTIANQVAITVQGMQLLEQTANRAKREQLLRELTNQVNTASGTDAILRRAAEHIGRVLKKPAYVYLGVSETKSQELPAESPSLIQERGDL